MFAQEPGTEVEYGRQTNQTGLLKRQHFCAQHCSRIISRNMFVVRHKDNETVFRWICDDCEKKEIKILQGDDVFKSVFTTGSSGFETFVVISKEKIDEKTPEEWREFISF